MYHCDFYGMPCILQDKNNKWSLISYFWFWHSIKLQHEENRTYMANLYQRLYSQYYYIMFYLILHSHHLIQLLRERSFNNGGGPWKLLGGIFFGPRMGVDFISDLEVLIVFFFISYCQTFLIIVIKSLFSWKQINLVYKIWAQRGCICIHTRRGLDCFT